jgi:hypothetical protein
VLSTVYPGPAHDPSIALVLAGPQAEKIRWIDARQALVIPPGTGAQALIPASTPPHPAFTDYLQFLETITLRSDDLDPGFTHYALDPSPLSSNMAGNIQANFGGAIILEDAHWFAPQVQPGETAELVTRWQVIDPGKAGPVHTPTGTTGAVIFAHVLDKNEQIIAQKDTLDAPSWAWQTGDTILQVHLISIPIDAEPGSYTTILGIYDRPTGQRLPLLGDGSSATAIQIPPLQVAQSPSSTQN